MVSGCGVRLRALLLGGGGGGGGGGAFRAWVLWGLGVRVRKSGW